jgi:hypothetical protein
VRTGCRVSGHPARPVQPGLLRPRPGVANVDTDGDGAPDNVENAVHTLVDNPDSDGDGMPDGYEITNELNPLADDASGDADNDGLLNITEYKQATDPTGADSNKDGKTDATDPAADGSGDEGRTISATSVEDDDGLTVEQEKVLGTDPTKSDTDGNRIPDGPRTTTATGSPTPRSSRSSWIRRRRSRRPASRTATPMPTATG